VFRTARHYVVASRRRQCWSASHKLTMSIEWKKQGPYLVSEPVWVVNRVGRLTFQGGSHGGKLYFQDDSGVDGPPRFIDKFKSWHAAKMHVEKIAEPVKRE